MSIHLLAWTSNPTTMMAIILPLKTKAPSELEYIVDVSFPRIVVNTDDKKLERRK